MSINAFTASGRLGSDMEVSYTPSGKCIGSVNIAVESGWGDNKKTSWVTLKVLGERAQKLSQYLTKGSQVSFTGEFVYEEWEKDGVKRGKPVVIVRDFQLPSNQHQQGNYQQPQQQGGYHQTQNNQPEYDSDLPF